MAVIRGRASARPSFPAHIIEDDRLVRRVRVGLAGALSSTLTESEWKKVATLHGLEAQITNHPRFLRSMNWGDPDFEGHVIDLVDYLHERDRDVLAEMFLRDDVQRWLQSHDKDLLDLWRGDADPLISALSHGIDELHASMGSIDLGEYSRRIQDALPSDPKLAIGATKEMLEATMRTILHNRGVNEVEKFEFSTLTTRCMNDLGLLPNTPPASKAEGFIRKIASTAKTMIEVANDLRNHAGTGHGKVAAKRRPYRSPMRS